MEKIEEFRDLLALLEQLGVTNSEATKEEFLASGDDGERDEEASEWASLILAANGTHLREARIRTCRSGLEAVNRYISERGAA